MRGAYLVYSGDPLMLARHGCAVIPVLPAPPRRDKLREQKTQIDTAMTTCRKAC